MDWITIFVGIGCFAGGLIAGLGVVAHLGMLRAMAPPPLPPLPEFQPPERRGEEDARRHHAYARAYRRTLAELRESEGAAP